MDEAKRFYDWALTPEAQALALQANSYQVPSNVNAPTSDKSPDLSSIKLIDYDFAKYGSSDERKRLLQKWDEDRLDRRQEPPGADLLDLRRVVRAVCPALVRDRGLLDL